MISLYCKSPSLFSALAPSTLLTSNELTLPVALSGSQIFS